MSKIGYVQEIDNVQQIAIRMLYNVIQTYSAHDRIIATRLHDTVALQLLFIAPNCLDDPYTVIKDFMDYLDTEYKGCFICEKFVSSDKYNNRLFKFNNISKRKFNSLYALLKLKGLL